jgi:hypothetical protein
MNTEKLGRGLVGLGVSGIILSLLVDVFPGAKPGIQSVQILGIEIAIIVILTGIWIFLAENSEELNVRKRVAFLYEQALNLPILIWIMVGFLISYILFFVSPMFLNSIQRMQYFINYLPDKYPIGNDMIVMLDLAKDWFFHGQSPYAVQFYPPLTYIFYAPSLLISDYALLFRLFTFITLVSYFILTFFMPAKISGDENKPLLLLFFITGLISYGFQFELERGQYNVFTFLLCMLSIYIFYYHPKRRIVAYILFSLSVQLKLYPAIFIVLLVDDWRNWKGNLRRFVYIGIFNFVLLFSMGYQVFLEFVASVSHQMSTPGWGWDGNHSIKAFVGNLAKDGFGVLSSNSLSFVNQNSEFIGNILLLVVLASVVSGVLIHHLKKEKGIDGYLLLICTIAALTIPISNDYTLSILAAPMAIFLCSLVENWNNRFRIVLILSVIILSFAYSSMLIPFKYKPQFMSNSFPPLFIILILTSFLNFIRYFSRRQIISENKLENLPDNGRSVNLKPSG